MAKKKKFMESKSLESGVTPKGLASWAFIKNPKTDDDGRTKFRITLIWGKDGEGVADFKKSIQKWMKEAAKHFGVKAAQVKVAISSLDKATIDKAFTHDSLKDRVSPGDLSMEFSSIRKSEDEIIPVVNAKAQPCDSEPWAGDTCRVQFNAVAYKAGGNVGVKLYLAGVQIVEQVNGGGSVYSADLFDAVEGVDDDDCDDNSVESADDDLTEEELDDLLG